MPVAGCATVSAHRDSTAARIMQLKARTRQNLQSVPTRFSLLTLATERVLLARVLAEFCWLRIVPPAPRLVPRARKYLDTGPRISAWTIATQQQPEMSCGRTQVIELRWPMGETRRRKRAAKRSAHLEQASRDDVVAGGSEVANRPVKSQKQQMVISAGQAGGSN